MFVYDPKADIRRDRLERISLDEWQSAFWSLYGHVNRRMNISDMMLQLVGDSARLAEAIRKRRYAEARPVVPRIFSWLANMTSKVAMQRGSRTGFQDLGAGRSLSEIVWTKYPFICSYCGNCPCTCLLKDLDAEKEADKAEAGAAERRKAETGAHIKDALRDNDAVRPKTLDDWVDMFDKVFGPANRLQTSALKTFHYFEEVGEVEQELRRADERVTKGRRSAHHTEPTPWENEVADVFSWLVAIFLHVRGFSRRVNDYLVDPRDVFDKQPPITLPRLSEWIWDEFGSEYGLRCHRCYLTRCDMSRQTESTAFDNRNEATPMPWIPRRR